MIQLLFRDDAYLKTASAQVIAVNDLDGIILDQSLYYPTGGGQPGDCGQLIYDGQPIPIVTAVKGDADRLFWSLPMVLNCQLLVQPLSNIWTGIKDTSICVSTLHCICCPWLFPCRSQAVKSLPTKAVWILLCPNLWKIKPR